MAKSRSKSKTNQGFSRFLPTTPRKGMLSFVFLFAISGAIGIVMSYATPLNSPRGLCSQNLVSPPSVGTCRSNIKVTTGGYPEAGKCYSLALNASKTSFVYKPADCSKPPFAGK